MKTIKTSIAALLVGSCLAATGCSVTPSAPQYIESQSLALNAARSVGLEGLKDRKAPAGGVGTLTQSAEFDAVYVGSAFSTGMVGLTSLQSGVFALLDVATKDGPNSTRSAVFGWMPQSHMGDIEPTLGNTSTAFLKAIDEALIKTLEQKGYDYTAVEAVPGLRPLPQFYAGYYIHDESIGCPSRENIFRSEWHYLGEHKPKQTSMCVVRVNLQSMKEKSLKRLDQPRPSPKDMRIAGHSDAMSYALYTSLSSKTGDMNVINVTRGKDSTLAENELYMDISRNLPDWLFLYLAPKKVHNAAGEPIPFPYVLNKGEPHFFVRPE